MSTYFKAGGIKKVTLRCKLQKLLCMLLICTIVFTSTACASSPPALTLSDPNEQIITENIEVETILTENRLKEFITEEIYLEELIIAEDKIAELLLEEDSIDEVLLCKTIYIPQDHIEDFASNSQTSQLFGDGVNITSLLKKVAVGTGVILTVVVLKKVGLPQPVASIVAGAASESLKFAGSGAAIGSLIGGLTGAADGIDESGRTSAVLGFAIATVGLIISAVHLVGLIPSGGVSSVGVGLGVKLVIAGIGVITGTAAMATTGYKAVKAFTATDANEIDWLNIDWNHVGVSAAEQAINYGADGYMWGAIVGTVYGGADGYDEFHKYHAPYTSQEKRISFADKGNKNGHWNGDPGQSDFILDQPIELSDGTKVTRITYKNGIPDFSHYAQAEVKIPRMSQYRTTSEAKLAGKDLIGNFEQADSALAEIWTRSRYRGQSWTARDVSNYRSENHLSWHEMSNMESMQLVPREIHIPFKHYGGVAECKAMVGQEGGEIFD